MFLSSHTAIHLASSYYYILDTRECIERAVAVTGGNGVASFSDLQVVASTSRSIVMVFYYGGDRKRRRK
jgi:hypothetical protein